MLSQLHRTVHELTQGSKDGGTGVSIYKERREKTEQTKTITTEGCQYDGQYSDRLTHTKARPRHHTIIAGSSFSFKKNRFAGAIDLLHTHPILLQVADGEAGFITLHSWDLWK